jgi:phosphotransferase system enzyme I (PtsI)
MKFSGLGTSAGVARGPVVVLRPRPADGPIIEDPVQALRAVASELQSLAESVGGAAAGILEAQALMAADPQLLANVADRHGSGQSGVEALRQAVAPFRAALEGARGDYQRERVADLDEILRRAISAMERRNGVDRHPPVPGILVGTSISAADTALFAPSELLGVVSSDGGHLSHLAILARSLGIPAVLGVGARVGDLEAGTWVAVDGSEGTVESVPSSGRSYGRRSAPPVRASYEGPARTADGVAVRVQVNLGDVADARRAATLGVDGAGLVRTELVFAGRDTAPSVDEQRAAYDELLDELSGPVAVRVIDAGADKPLRYVAHDSGPNPALGERGIRLLLRNVDLLTAQVRALCRSRHAERIKVLLPMVTRAEELHRVRQLLEPVFASEGRALEVGAMIEVPAAAICVREIASEAAFISIGTNDLLQYLFAVDRVSALTREIIDPLPADVWRLLAGVFDAAAAHGIEASVCGELAAEADGGGILWALGATSLSVSPGRVDDVREALRRRTADEWRALASDALGGPARSSDPWRSQYASA